MSGYLLLVESFYYGLTQSALDDCQDYLIKLPREELPIKCVVGLHGLLFFIFILRLSRLLNNYVETLIFLIFIADTNETLKSVALGTSIIFNANSLIYYLTCSYIIAYSLRLHKRYYTEALITYLSDLIDRHYNYFNIPNYLLYYLCTDQKY